MRLLHRLGSTFVKNSSIVQFVDTCQCLGNGGITRYLDQRFASSSSTINCDVSCHYQSVIGLEIHVQINSKSKLFSRSSNQFLSTPNVHVSLFDCAIPGSLPVINKYCIEAAVKCGLALNCQISQECCFDRKHYFYPDTPSGYQITQKRQPIATNGYLFYPVFRWKHKLVRIKKAPLRAIQLEQDTGKSIQDLTNKQNLLDLNRCGVGLMELVFEPCLESEEEAVSLVKELIQILKRLDVCNCKMEEGAVRVDANISVSSDRGKKGNKVEIKNLNSLNSLSRALEYEKQRQIDLLKSGSPVTSETRFYDPHQKQTYLMREKDDVQDYRYIPEPNLPPLRLSFKNDSQSIISIPRLKSSLPLLPEDERNNLIQEFKIPTFLAAIIVDNNIYNFFHQIFDLKSSIKAEDIADFLALELVRSFESMEKTISEVDISPEFLVQCLELIQTNTISTGMALDLIEAHINHDKRPPTVMVDERGLKMAEDQSLVREECLHIIKTYPKTALKAKKGAYRSFDLLCDGVERRCEKRFSRSLILSTFKEIIGSLEERELRRSATIHDKKMKEAVHLFSEIDAMNKHGK